MRITPLAVAAVLALVTGCGDDGDDLDPEAEQELLEEAIITVDDLPEGFEVEEEGDDDDDNDAFEECTDELDVDPDAVDDVTVAEAGPADFELSEAERNVQVGVELATVSDEDVVTESIEALEDEELLDCMANLFQELVAETAGESGEFEAETTEPAADGDAAGAIRFSGEVAGFSAVAEIHVVLVDNHLVTVEVTTVNDETDEDLVQDVFDTMLERLEDGG